MPRQIDSRRLPWADIVDLLCRDDVYADRTVALSLWTEAVQIIRNFFPFQVHHLQPHLARLYAKRRLAVTFIIENL